MVFVDLPRLAVVHTPVSGWKLYIHKLVRRDLESLPGCLVQRPSYRITSKQKSFTRTFFLPIAPVGLSSRSGRRRLTSPPVEICSCKELKLKATCAWVAPGSEKDESKKQRRKRHMRDGRNILVAPKPPLPKSKFTWGRTSESFDFMYLPQEGLNFLWVRSILALSKNSFFVIAFCFYA